MNRRTAAGERPQETAPDKEMDDCVICLNCLGFPASPAFDIADYWECSHCGFLFVGQATRRKQLIAMVQSKQSPAHDEMDQLVRKYPRDLHPKRSLYARIARRLVCNLDVPVSTARAVDIGANGGFFLRQLELLGIPATNLMTTEVSSAYARLNSHYFDYRCELQYAEQLHLNGKVEIITMFDVLEHVADFDRALERASAPRRPPKLPH